MCKTQLEKTQHVEGHPSRESRPAGLPVILWFWVFFLQSFHISAEASVEAACGRDHKTLDGRTQRYEKLTRSIPTGDIRLSAASKCAILVFLSFQSPN